MTENKIAVANVGDVVMCRWLGQFGTKSAVVVVYSRPQANLWIAEYRGKYRTILPTGDGTGHWNGEDWTGIWPVPIENGIHIHGKVRVNSKGWIEDCQTGRIGEVIGYEHGTWNPWVVAFRGDQRIEGWSKPDEDQVRKYQTRELEAIV